MDVVAPRPLETTRGGGDGGRGPIRPSDSSGSESVSWAAEPFCQTLSSLEAFSLPLANLE